MANTSSPNGLVPYRHLTGGSIRVSEYKIAAAYSTAIYKGDPVELTGTSGNIQLAAADNDENIGVFAGCQYVDASGNQHFSKYWPGTAGATDIVALVYDDPDITYQIQVDTMAATDIGMLIQWVAGTGSTLTGLSGAYGGISTAAETAAQLRLLRLIPRVDNEYGAYAKAEVHFAEHALSNVIAGVGGVDT